MVLVTVWQNYQKENENVVKEAVLFSNSYRVAESLDSADCVKVRGYIKRLINGIIVDSWPKMEEGLEGTYVKASFYTFVFPYFKYSA